MQSYSSEYLASLGTLDLMIVMPPSSIPSFRCVIGTLTTFKLVDSPLRPFKPFKRRKYGVNELVQREQVAPSHNATEAFYCALSWKLNDSDFRHLENGMCQEAR
jgi:hypothetical protein